MCCYGLLYRDQSGYVTEWTYYKSQNESIGTIEAIFLQVSRKEPCAKVVTIKLYITTLTVTLQGKNIKSWVDTEFEVLKDFVYANQNIENSIQSHDITHNDTTETVRVKMMTQSLILMMNKMISVKLLRKILQTNESLNLTPSKQRWTPANKVGF